MDNGLNTEHKFQNFGVDWQWIYIKKTRPPVWYCYDWFSPGARTWWRLHTAAASCTFTELAARYWLLPTTA